MAIQAAQRLPCVFSAEFAWLLRKAAVLCRKGWSLEGWASLTQPPRRAGFVVTISSWAELFKPVSSLQVCRESLPPVTFSALAYLVLLTAFSACSLFAYTNATDFCVLPLHPATLMNSFIRSNSVCVCVCVCGIFIGFST